MCEFLDKLVQIKDYENAKFILECIKQQDNYSEELIALAILVGGNRNYKYTNYITTEKTNMKYYRWIFKNDPQFVYRIPISNSCPRFVLVNQNHKMRFVLANFWEEMDGVGIYAHAFQKVRKKIKRTSGIKILDEYTQYI